MLKHPPWAATVNGEENGEKNAAEIVHFILQNYKLYQPFRVREFIILIYGNTDELKLKMLSLIITGTISTRE